MPTQAAYEEALYSRPVSKRTANTRWVRPFTLLALLVLALLAWNYFTFGYGPNWAHRPVAASQATWRTFRADGWSALLPGNPVQSDTPTDSGDYHSYVVLVDGNWESILDADIISPGLRAQAIANQHATVAVAVTPSSGDLAAAAPALVQQLAPNATYQQPKVTTPSDGGFGTQVEYTAQVSDGAEAAPDGTVRARLVSDGATTWVLATFTANGDDTALNDAVVGGFKVGSGLEGHAVVH
jgi:hypothetical protein